MAANQDDLNEYFMNVAVLTAHLSKDPKLKVGACLVQNNKIISTGYNSMPPGCDELFHNKDKNDYVIHAELNAISNCPCKVENVVLFSTYYPCNECAKKIATSNVKKVYFLNAKEGSKFKFDASLRILNSYGIEIKRFEPKTDGIGNYKYGNSILGGRNYHG